MPDLKKTIAIHQPNYFPWLGFFYKIYASDVFIFHDNVEHSKRYPTRRTRIRKAHSSDETCWLTVPLKKHSDFTLIKDLEIDHSQDWQGKHLRKISNSYSSAAFFSEAFPKIEDWLSAAKRFDLLADFNIFLIKNMLTWMGIERETFRSSAVPVEGKGSAYNVALVKQLGGAVYLSGKGGDSYQQEAEFSRENIRLAVNDFKSILAVNFSQLLEEKVFEVGFFILDPIFNLGIPMISSLLQETSKLIEANSLSNR